MQAPIPSEAEFLRSQPSIFKTSSDSNILLRINNELFFLETIWQDTLRTFKNSNPNEPMISPSRNLSWGKQTPFVNIVSIPINLVASSTVLFGNVPENTPWRGLGELFLPHPWQWTLLHINQRKQPSCVILGSSCSFYKHFPSLKACFRIFFFETWVQCLPMDSWGYNVTPCFSFHEVSLFPLNMNSPW